MGSALVDKFYFILPYVVRSLDNCVERFAGMPQGTRSRLVRKKENKMLFLLGYAGVRHGVSLPRCAY